MKIGFIYNAPCSILELSQNPSDIAGAAICYLAIQLAKLGNDVTIFSQGVNGMAYNVRCRHIEIMDLALVLDPALLENDFAVLIFKNTTPEFAIRVKDALPYKPKVYLWTNNDHTAKYNEGLWSQDIVDKLTGILCVSSWQRNQFIDTMHIAQNKIFVLKYAIAPLFEDLFVDGKEFINTKSKAPRIAYIAAQDNGLEVLLDSYFNISDNYQNASLGIFSSITDQNLLEAIKSSRGIAVYGDLAKLQLAAWLRTYTIFANPNTMAATSNITLLEAMAAGLYPVTSDVGANDDYCHGHGKIIPSVQLLSASLDSFISEMLTVCQGQILHAKDFYDYCFKQTVDINKKHTWRVRAKELLDLLGNEESRVK